MIIYLIPVSFEFAMREHRFKSGTMGVPMSVLFISLTVGLVLTAIQLVFEMILHYRNKEAA